MKTNRLAYIILGAALLASCSVKEDRTPCPSYLTVYYDQAIPVMTANGINTGVITSVVNPAGFWFRRDIDPAEYPAGLEIPVTPKSVATVSGVAGISTAELGSDLLTYRRGVAADHIWAGSDPVDCTDELAEHHVTLHKQFALMHVTFRGSEAYPDLRLEIRATCNAMEAATLLPSKGEFRCDLERDGTDSFRTCIPRQDNNDLLLLLWSGEDLLSEIAVGKSIATAGYNWSKRDLDDIEVYIDYAVPDISFEIAPWKDGGYNNYVI